jgi:hypothetical protein
MTMTGCGDWVEYQVGQRVGCSATFTNELDQPADPSSVVVTVMRPDGTVVALTPSNPAVGLWTARYNIDQPGRHYYSFKGSGFITAERESHFDVVLRREPA